MADTVDVDIIWQKLGTWGRFQRKQLGVYLFSCFSWVFHSLTIVFIGFRPPFTCSEVPGPNITEDGDTQWREYGKCNIMTYTNTSEGLQITETGCTNGWTYGIPSELSIVTEWDLVCERAELAELSQALVTVGQMVGSLFVTGMSDRFGRRPITTASHVLLFALALGTSFTPDFTSFLVLRFFTGIMQQGVGLVGSTMALENFPKEVRAYTETLALVWWTTAIVIMVPIAYLMRALSWRYIQMTFALFSAWALLEWWMLDESLRWLIANGKIDRATVLLKKACRMNKKDFDEIAKASGFNKLLGDGDQDMKELLPVGSNISSEVGTKTMTMTEGHVETDRESRVDPDTATITANEQQKNGASLLEPEVKMDVAMQPKMEIKRYTAFDILRRKHLLLISLILWVVWVTDSLVYFGLYLISDSLAGDRYVNFLLNGIIEYPAAFGEYLLINRIGRKKTSILAHAIAAFGLLVSTVLIYTAGSNAAMLTASTAFAVIGKMGSTAAFSAAFIFTPELYPTNMRNAGFGMAAMAGKIGGICSPFFRNLAEISLWAPGAIFTILCIIVMLLLLLIPETSGVELPQTMEELKKWHKLNAIVKTGRRRKITEINEEERQSENRQA